MLLIGISLVGTGLYWFFLMPAPCKSQKDVQRSLQREQENKEEWGILAGNLNKFEWAARAQYRHPVVMRLPGVITLLAGALLLVADLAN